MADPKVVILTGASRGIGLAIAHFLLKKDCRLVVVSRSKGPLEQLDAAYPDRVQVLAGDLSDLTIGQKAVDTALAAWKHIDGLIVNHGVLEPIKKISEFEPSEWQKAFDTNVFSAVAIVKAALPALRESKGRIVFTSSGAATGAYTTWGAYGATKAVLNHVAATLSVEEPDVTSIAIRPGTVDTEMQRDIREKHSASMDKKDVEKFGNLHKTGSLLKPEQPGNVIARLALDAPKELSGKFLNWNHEELARFQDA